MQWLVLYSLLQVEKFCHCMHGSWDLNDIIRVALPLHHPVSDFRQDFQKVMTVMMLSDNLDQRLF